MLCFYPPTSPPDRGIRHSTTQVILKMHTFKKCPPRWISPLQCALTKNAPASPLQSALTKSQDLNSWNEHLQKTPGGRGVSTRHSPLSTFNWFLEVHNVRRTTVGARHISEPVVDGTWGGCYKFSSFVQCPAKSAEAWGAF